eukprot:Opistho-1_new@36750
MSRRTLFVAGISPRSRPRDVAYEFERFGRLVRCDMPAGVNGNRGYAFVEFEDERDAMDAYDAMQGRTVDGARVQVQWQKHPPSRTWRGDDGAPHGGGGRPRSPPR